jgi:hypothetical protein
MLKLVFFVYQNEKQFTKTDVLLRGSPTASNFLEQNTSEKQAKKFLNVMETERSLPTNSSVTSLQPKSLCSISSI